MYGFSRDSVAENGTIEPIDEGMVIGVMVDGGEFALTVSSSEVRGDNFSFGGFMA